MQLGLVLGELGEQHVRARDEHAGVPQVGAVGEVRLGGLEIGLLDEALDERRLGGAVDDDLAALLDVAEADRRLDGRDADRADVALAGGRDRLAHRPVEHLRAPDHVVGGERADDDVGLAAREDRRGEPDRGGGVAGLGLEEHVLVGDAGQLAARRRRGARGPSPPRCDRRPDSGSRRSQVSRSSVCPEPVRSCRNLGASARDSGHSLLPMPPAGMTA